VTVRFVDVVGVVGPPGEFDIFVQARSATGEIGEGAVAVGTFTAPGQGSLLIPGGTPVNSFCSPCRATAAR